VGVAVDGRDAVEQFAGAAWDALLMDVQMPEMDGIEATRRIRELPLAHQPEIVAMTASVLERDRDECLEAGMDAFLVKPFRPADVAKTLEACHGRLESAGDAATPERELVRRGA
jgi:CheY-like chemotaxis protein